MRNRTGVRIHSRFYFTAMIAYILYSPKLDKYYTGVSTETVEERLTKHNTGLYGQHFTSQTNDWKIFLVIPCDCNAQMLKIEKYIKNMKSSIYIENLKRYPEMISKLKTKFLCN
jgi:putative endonuclease